MVLRMVVQILRILWNWKANGAGVANTDGTISSTVSANTTSGFSIVSYTGNGTSNSQTSRSWIRCSTINGNNC